MEIYMMIRGFQMKVGGQMKKIKETLDRIYEDCANNPLDVNNIMRVKKVKNGFNKKLVEYGINFNRMEFTTSIYNEQ